MGCRKCLTWNKSVLNRNSVVTSNDKVLNVSMYNNLQTILWIKWKKTMQSMSGFDSYTSLKKGLWFEKEKIHVMLKEFWTWDGTIRKGTIPLIIVWACGLVLLVWTVVVGRDALIDSFSNEAERNWINNKRLNRPQVKLFCQGKIKTNVHLNCMT